MPSAEILLASYGKVNSGSLYFALVLVAVPEA